ncbi:MAG TPA: hypothetical protein VK864_14505, partial [Longimicrobiales bacterium]|nr:hypothetical protein [Longimicrobiales bacterium]
MKQRFAFLLALAAALAACERAAPTNEADSAALATITTADLLRHTQALAADSMEGRAPGTIGEERAVRYLISQFQALGLQPGNPNGTFTQDVPLVGMTAEPTAWFSAGGKRISLSFPNEYVAMTRRVTPQVDVQNSDIVFVGYGVVAPEYGWDDYKGVDVKGKTIVMLINDPAITMPNDTTVLDTTKFRGRAMTYYGRWTYKYEIAAQKGAAAALIIHETGPAGYPYEVVKGSWSAEQFDVISPDAAKRVPVEGWITLEKA